MEGVIQQAIERQVLQAVQAAEDAVDDELHRLENLKEVRAGGGAPDLGRYDLVLTAAAALPGRHRGDPEETPRADEAHSE